MVTVIQTLHKSKLYTNPRHTETSAILQQGHPSLLMSARLTGEPTYDHVPSAC